MEEIFKDEAVRELLERYKIIWSLDHAIRLLSWDLRVMMPQKGVEERSIATANITVLKQKLLLSHEILELLDKAEGREERLNDYELGVLRYLKREIHYAKALPPSLLKEYTQTVGEARVRWREARRRNKYEIFKPYLEKIIDLSRKMADHLGYEEHPYDALLDRREEGFTVKDVDKIFNVLEPGIKRILEKVTAEGHYPSRHELEKKKYDVDVMVKLNREILEKLGYPLGVRSRLDVSTHPFTTGIGIRDVRITTRYAGLDFKRSLFGAIHEFGHALYNLQLDEKFMTTPLARGASSGIHESQSRFCENMIGRSREFAEAAYPIIKKHLKFVGEYTPEELYLYFNMVRPSLIRVDADEVTYNLHILLRYRLEKMMITGEVKVEELPERWNNLMEELLGVRPKTDTDGLLQDVHWSSGLAGFPAYTIGNIVSAQIKFHAEKELMGLERYIKELEFKPIREYLREKIHRWGATYPPKELVKRILGEEIDPKYLIRYLERKYLR